MTNEQQAELGRAYSEREACRAELNAAIRLHRAAPDQEGTERRLMRAQERYTLAATKYEVLENAFRPADSILGRNA